MGDRNDDDRSPLRTRLAAAWQARSILDFYSAVNDELHPKIRRSLRKDYADLSDEDLDDCIGEAVCAFAKRNDPTVANPESYIWTSARHEACDMLEERARAREVEDTTVDGELPDAITEAAAVVLIEGLVDDIEVAPSWAVEVVRIAVERLRPALRNVIVYILEHGTDAEGAASAAALGISHATFRANKSNAQDALRSIIPLVIAERGIVFASARLTEVFAVRHPFAEEDDE